MTDLLGFLPCFGVTGPGYCIMKATKKFFRSLFRLNMKLKKMTRVDSMWRVWSLRTTDGKEVVAKKIFRV